MKKWDQLDQNSKKQNVYNILQSSQMTIFADFLWKVRPPLGPIFFGTKCGDKIVSFCRKRLLLRVLEHTPEGKSKCQLQKYPNLSMYDSTPTYPSPADQSPTSPPPPPPSPQWYPTLTPVSYVHTTEIQNLYKKLTDVALPTSLPLVTSFGAWYHLNKKDLHPICIFKGRSLFTGWFNVAGHKNTTL